MKKIKEQSFQYKIICVSIIFILILSLIPILYIAFFNHATGDDLIEGAALHQVIVNNGTVSEFLHTFIDTIVYDYNSWEGNWSSIILWILEPSIWGERFYVISTFIALLCIFSGFSYFYHHIIKYYLKTPKYFEIILSLSVIFFAIQFLPYPRAGLYWYTGIVNYLPPFALMLCSIVWIDKYIKEGINRYIVFTSVAMLYISGAGYMTVVLSFEIIVLFFVYFLIKIKEKEVRKRIFLLLIPFSLLSIGFLVSAISPGNAVRGGDSYKFDIYRVFTTIYSCIEEGIKSIPHFFWNARLFVIFLPFLVIMCWELIDINKSIVKFKYPVRIVIITFLLYCSTYAPEIYSLGMGGISGGVYNTYWHVFLVFITLNTIYIICSIKMHCQNVNNKSVSIIRHFYIVFSILFCLVCYKYLIGNTVNHICVEYISSGELYDYRDQINEQLEVLTDPTIKDAVIYQMNPEQGPLMLMTPDEDPEKYSNRAVAQFYGKNSVVAIPRK